MIDLGFLKRLIETVESSDIDTLEISRWGTKIRISKSAPYIAGNAAASQVPVHELRVGSAASNAEAGDERQAVAASKAAEAPGESGDEEGAAEGYFEVTSPMVGTFYRAPSPGAPPYVEVGDRVRKGQTLCILEAMKLMNELESEVDGTVKQVLVENAQPVEYGQSLFRIQPD